MAAARRQGVPGEGIPGARTHFRFWCQNGLPLLLRFSLGRLGSFLTQVRAAQPDPKAPTIIPHALGSHHSSSASWHRVL